MFRLLTVLLLVVPAPAKQYAIVALEARGSERYAPRQVIAATGLKVDISRPVELDAVRAAAQRLVSSGAFSDVGYRHEAVPGGMKVSFTVTDKAADQFLPLTFENVVWFDDASLREQIALRVPLFRNDVPLDGSLENEIAEAIQGALADKQVNAHVSSTLSCAPGQESCIRQFAVDNLDIQPTEIAIEGAPAEIAREVAGQARTSIIGKAYRASSTGRGLQRLIRAACLRRGMLKPRLGDIKPEVLGQDAGRVRIALRTSLVAGPSYKFEGQAWTGNSALPSAQLQKLLHLYQHLPVDGAKLEQDLEQVRAVYAMHGYMNARIHAVPDLNDSDGTVRYTFEVNEGALFRMGTFELSGFPSKLVEEITALWKLREGDPFNRVYAKQFFAEPRVRELFSGRQFVVEQSEGTTPERIDVTIALCHPAGCKPSPDAIYVTADPDN